MTVNYLDPPGIDAAGRGGVWFVPAIADINAPTVAEITAGVNLSCALYGFNPGGEQSSVNRWKYCYTETVQTPGRTSRTISEIQYDYDPQKPAEATGGYAYYASLVPGTHGFIVDRRGLTRDVAIAAGQIVDVYPVTLGDRFRVEITEEEGAKLRTRQTPYVVGEAALDVAVVAG